MRIHDRSGQEIITALWARLKDRLRRAPIASAEGFAAFIEQRAALIAQKCATDYCRGKTGLASYALFSERTFLDAFDICRWETFVATLADLLIVAEGQLRAHVSEAEQPRLRQALIDLHAAILHRMPPPALRAQGWDDAIASFEARLGAASRDRPQQALDVADRSAKRLFDTLPIHISYRELDEEVVYGAVRFRMIAVSQEMQRRVAAAELARQLIG